MPNRDFYAVAKDHEAVLAFIFSRPGWSALELSSRTNRALREFRSTPEVLRAFALDQEDLYLQIYNPEMQGAVRIHKIHFKPGSVAGTAHRFESSGWGLIQLYLRAVRRGHLSPSHTNCNSQRRALNWEQTCKQQLGPVDAWNWKAVMRSSSTLNRFIRKLAVAKAGSRQVLPSAHRLKKRGVIPFALN